MTQYAVVTPASEINVRISKLQKGLQEQGMGGALVVQNTDLFYFINS